MKNFLILYPDGTYSFLKFDKKEKESVLFSLPAGVVLINLEEEN